MHANGRKPEGRRPLERPRHSWDDNIEMNQRYRLRGCALDPLNIYTIDNNYWSAQIHSASV
jgi:hypothetical protein